MTSLSPANQLSLESLYAGQVPHEVTSRTSRAAANAVTREHRAALHALVLDAICRAGSKGLTDDELQVKLGLRSQTQSPRRRELELIGLVVDSERTRKTRKGRPAAVWIVTERGGTVYRQANGETWRPHGTLPDAGMLQRLSFAISTLRKEATASKPPAHRHMWRYVIQMAWLVNEAPPGRNLYQPVECPRCKWDWLAGVIEAKAEVPVLAPKL